MSDNDVDGEDGSRISHRINDEDDVNGRSQIDTETEDARKRKWILLKSELMDRPADRFRFALLEEMRRLKQLMSGTDFDGSIHQVDPVERVTVHQNQLPKKHRKEPARDDRVIPERDRSSVAFMKELERTIIERWEEVTNVPDHEFGETTPEEDLEIVRTLFCPVTDEICSRKCPAYKTCPYREPK